MSHRLFCEAFLAALDKGDFDTLGAMMDPDFQVQEAAGLPYAGTYHGIEGWQMLCKSIVTAWAGLKVSPIEFLGETPDSIVLRLSLRGRGRKTGTPFETTVMELWRFRNGKVREIMPYYWDTAYLAQAYER